MASAPSTSLLCLLIAAACFNSALGRLHAARPVDLGEPQQLPRIAVVNARRFHYEVLGGWTSLLESLQWPMSVHYLGPDTLLMNNGVFEWLGIEKYEATREQHQGAACNCHISQLGTKWCSIDNNCTASIRAIAQADIVLCVSPEYDVGACRSIARALKPGLLLTIVHRPLEPTDVLNLYPKQQILALAPHVAAHKSEQLRMPIDWVLPVAPFRPPTGACMSRSCLDGFVIQGNIRKHQDGGLGMTRDFNGIWASMLRLKQAAARGAPPVNALVLGKGKTADLGIPKELKSNIRHFSDLPYPAFWGKIYHSLAIVPAFNMDTYYTQRFSSTILASLVTGTPLIADQRLLDAYSFLKPQHVFLMEPGEDEVTAMYRIVSLPSSEIVARRVALGQLRMRLNQRTATQLREWAALAGAAPATATYH